MYDSLKSFEVAGYVNIHLVISTTNGTLKWVILSSNMSGTIVIYILRYLLLKLFEYPVSCFLYSSVRKENLLIVN